MFRLRALIQASNARDKYLIPRIRNNLIPITNKQSYSHKHSHQYPIVDVLKKENIDVSIKEKIKIATIDASHAQNINTINSNTYILLDDIHTKTEESKQVIDYASAIAEESSTVTSITDAISDAISGLKDL